MKWFLVPMLLAVGLAGCSDGESATVDDVDFSDVEAKVDDATGLIRGVVVDASINPVEAATVRLVGPGMEENTDAQGRFVFTGLAPGAYFIEVEKTGYTGVQSNTDVVAGLAEPPVVKIQIERLFEADPYTVAIKADGFFQCSQAGLLIGIYSSSNCVTDYTRRVTGPPGLAPELDNVTNQEREWHADVPGGWQDIVFEMEWEPTAQGTSEAMGMVVSTYKPERDGSHWFANEGGGSPLRFQLHVGEVHPTAGTVDPKAVPEEGMQDMSYFVSVRQDEWPVPAVSLSQEFSVYIHMFVYGEAPEGWSLLAGDEVPF